eukprot:gene6467-biopygen13429
MKQRHEAPRSRWAHPGRGAAGEACRARYRSARLRRWWFCGWVVVVGGGRPAPPLPPRPARGPSCRFGAGRPARAPARATGFPWCARSSALSRDLVQGARPGGGGTRPPPGLHTRTRRSRASRRGGGTLLRPDLPARNCARVRSSLRGRACGCFGAVPCDFPSGRVAFYLPTAARRRPHSTDFGEAEVGRAGVLRCVLRLLVGPLVAVEVHVTGHVGEGDVGAVPPLHGGNDKTSGQEGSKARVRPGWYPPHNRCFLPGPVGSRRTQSAAGKRRVRDVRITPAGCWL